MENQSKSSKYASSTSLRQSWCCLLYLYSASKMHYSWETSHFFNLYTILLFTSVKRLAIARQTLGGSFGILKCYKIKDLFITKRLQMRSFWMAPHLLTVISSSHRPALTTQPSPPPPVAPPVQSSPTQNPLPQHFTPAPSPHNPL